MLKPQGSSNERINNMNIIINESHDTNHDRLVLEAIMRGEATSQLHFGIDSQTNEFRVDWYKDKVEEFANDYRRSCALPDLRSGETLQVAELVHSGIVFGWGEYDVCPLEEEIRIKVVFLDSSKNKFVPELFQRFGHTPITQRLGGRSL